MTSGDGEVPTTSVAVGFLLEIAVSRAAVMEVLSSGTDEIGGIRVCSVVNSMEGLEVVVDAGLVSMASSWVVAAAVSGSISEVLKACGVSDAIVGGVEGSADEGEYTGILV